MLTFNVLLNYSKPCLPKSPGEVSTLDQSSISLYGTLKIFTPVAGRKGLKLFKSSVRLNMTYFSLHFASKPSTINLQPSTNICRKRSLSFFDFEFVSNLL